MLDEKVYEQHLLSPQGHRGEIGMRLPEERGLGDSPLPPDASGDLLPITGQAALGPHNGMFPWEPWVDDAPLGFSEG